MTNSEINNAISAMAATLLQEYRKEAEMEAWYEQMELEAIEAENKALMNETFCECDGVSMGVGRYCSECLPIDPSEIGYTDGK